MIDRALGFNASQSFYFQLYPVNLILLQEPVPSEDSTFKFSIYKGQQKYDENKISANSNFIDNNGTYVMPFQGCQLNFYLPNFNKSRKVFFTLKLSQKDATEEYELGGIDIDPTVYITEFKQNGKTRFEQKVDISQQYKIQFEIYLQKSRFALQKIVKSFQGQRCMKSPDRERFPQALQKSPPFSLSEKSSEVQEKKLQSPSINKNKIKTLDQAINKKSELFDDSPNDKNVQQSFTKSLDKPNERPSIIKKDEPLFEENENFLFSKREQTNCLKVAKSQKSEPIVSPLIRSKQVKRSFNITESIRKSHNQIGETEPVIAIKTQNNSTWKNQFPLMAFTVIGILIIYFVMHPNSRI